MPTFKVWEECDTEEEAKTIVALSAVSAAERFAEFTFNRGDQFECMEVKVKEEGW